MLKRTLLLEYISIPTQPVLQITIQDSFVRLQQNRPVLIVCRMVMVLDANGLVNNGQKQVCVITVGQKEDNVLQDRLEKSKITVEGHAIIVKLSMVRWIPISSRNVLNMDVQQRAIAVLEMTAIIQICAFVKSIAAGKCADSLTIQMNVWETLMVVGFGIQNKSFGGYKLLQNLLIGLWKRVSIVENTMAESLVLVCKNVKTYASTLTTALVLPLELNSVQGLEPSAFPVLMAVCQSANHTIFIDGQI